MHAPGQSPRSPAGSAPIATLAPPAAPRTFEFPTQRTAPSRETIDAPTPYLPGGRQPIGGGGPSAPFDRVGGRRRVAMIVAVAVIVALGGGGTALAYVQRTQAAESARVAHSLEVAAQAQVFADEQVLLREQNSAAFWAATLAERATAVAAAAVSLEGSRGALAAAPQAGDAARNGLQQAIDAASAVLTAVPTSSVMTIDAAMASIVAPQQAAATAQAVWQVSEDARLAAEAAAAADAAAAASRAAAQAAAAAPARAPRATAKAPATAPGAAAAPAPAPAAPSTSVPEFSAGALGGAINAWRAGQGLPAMSISRSGSLVAHAGAMAQAGDIWHSGGDKIVGYVQPASAGALVQAWANSPGHRAWMVRTDVSSMQVGAVVLDNRLYGAVNFS